MAKDYEGLPGPVEVGDCLRLGALVDDDGVSHPVIVISQDEDEGGLSLAFRLTEKVVREFTEALPAHFKLVQDAAKKGATGTAALVRMAGRATDMRGNPVDTDELAESLDLGDTPSKRRVIH